MKPLTLKESEEIDLVVSVGGDGTCLVTSQVYPFLLLKTSRYTIQYEIFVLNAFHSCITSAFEKVNIAAHGKEVPYVLWESFVNDILFRFQIFAENLRAVPQNLKYGTPLVAVNSDPTPPEIRKHVYHSSQFDQARSTGHLCACGPDKLTKVMGEILDGVRQPTKLARIRTLLNGEELMPALNDILIAHPSPAAVSRYSYVWGRARKATEQERWSAEGSYQEYQHVRSSGIRLCTATGSTAANKSAGGQVMQLEDPRLQYMDREPISVDGTQCPISHAFLQPHEELELRWNSRVGYIYIDGAHTMREITIGDKLQFSTGVS
ncbi:hypothetical protein CYMTET_51118 [Cymbomonas tetramitiformis]|uniref:NAD(+) kinase n=1 Tax=Cymbomonas tetramitiformis TaxID=36881 RepID=A0AAE0BLS1_9CHLO|nr:hypothetical protein CYMTET_51118 [Cymbomonas tetramitiformis]